MAAAVRGRAEAGWRFRALGHGRGLGAERGLAWALVVTLGLGGCMKRTDGARGEGSRESVVYVARRVRTLDAARPLAEALWVEKGRIVAVGSKAELLERAGGEATVEELGDAVVVPGLVDAHAHLASLGRALVVVDLRGARSEDEVYARLEAASAESLQGDWRVGRSWDQNDWPGSQGQFPTRARLDALFPDRPVYLTRVDGHAAWVNGEALRRAGVTRATKDPEGGRIIRDAKGEPTGVLVDNAMELVSRHLPPLTQAQREARLGAALEHCARLGLTAIHDAGMDFETFTLLQQWDAVGALPLRVYAMADGQGGEAQTFLERGPFSGRHLELRAVKLLMDGALGSRGAALFEPYSDEPGQAGLLLLEPGELEARARAFMERGFQVAVHAIGDRANSLVLDGLGRAAEATGTKARRHRVEHAQIVRPEELKKFRTHGLIASVQPTHATSDMPWAPARVGEARLAGAYAWRKLMEAGAVLALGSDFPVEDAAPLLGLYAARTRQDAQGKPEGGWRPEERLSGEEALRGFTWGAAYAAHAEERRGTLAEGKDADFTVLSVDPVEDAPAALLGARVLRTVVAGRVVHAAP